MSGARPEGGRTLPRESPAVPPVPEAAPGRVGAPRRAAAAVRRCAGSALRRAEGPDRLRTLVTEALVVTASVAEALATRAYLPGALLPAALAVAVLLPLRRCFPRVLLLLALPTLATGVLWLPAMAALHAVAADRSRREAAAGAAAVAAVSFAPWQGVGDYAWTLPDITLGLLLSGLLAVAPAALGRLSLARRELAARLAELALSREREQRCAAEQAALRERERLAREVHDTAAHHLSLISLHCADLAAGAESAEHRRRAEALGALSRRAAVDLREAVHREGPGLAELPGLLEAAGAAAVRLDTGDCPPAVGRAAYRVVQEGLTNARRHAPGARAEVDVHREAGELRLRVSNGPPHRAATAAAPAGGGQGLPGLRARAAELGGTLSAGPDPGGGFLLEAAFPLR